MNPVCFLLVLMRIVIIYISHEKQARHDGRCGSFMAQLVKHRGKIEEK